MEFRKLPSLNNLYEINEYGVLRNVKTQKVVKGSAEKNGYQRVRIENKLLGAVIRTSIHQLVAEAFIPNPENKPQVNHKDLNKLNNHVSNLEWSTGSENMKHAYANGIGVECLELYRNSRKKKISNGNITFESISDGATWLCDSGKCKNKASGIAGISAVISGKRNTFGGYKWRIVA